LTDRIISMTFIIGSMLAAVAGILYGLSYPKIDPLMGIMPGSKRSSPPSRRIGMCRAP
jgi:branched-chain amino acid transport system permease protein